MVPPAAIPPPLCIGFFFCLQNILYILLFSPVAQDGPQLVALLVYCSRCERRSMNDSGSSLTHSLRVHVPRAPFCSASCLFVT